MTTAEQQQAVEQQALTVIERARALAVTTGPQYEEAGSFLTQIVKPMMREIDATFDPIVKSAHEAHKVAVAAKKKIADPVIAAEATVKKAMSAYSFQQEQERRRQEEELRRQAREQAELEAAARAEELAAQGRTAEGLALLEQPVYVAPVVLPPATPKAQGISTRDNWKFRVVDAKAIRPEYLIPNETLIGQVVRSMKGAAAQVVGGIEVYNEPTVSAR